jgi:RNA ligase (TIGR02306 family)
MERKLATIAQIESIHPIVDADNLEMAIIRGWQVVVKKEEFKSGDLCVYCEIDSVLPERPEFEFMAPRKYRVKTTKFRGQISQGIAFSLKSVLHPDSDPALGADVTELLGIKKYEEPIPACLGGVASGRFPTHSIKTDEERIQNLTEMYSEYHDDYTWTATEKLDGCLDENTILETEDGEKSIKEVCETRYKGKIKSFDLDKNEIVWKNVLNHSIEENDPVIKTRLINKLRPKHWYKIILENGKEIMLSENHEIWISNLLCWRRADELDSTEEFLLKN